MKPDKFASILRFSLLLLFLGSALLSLFNQNWFAFFSSFLTLMIIIFSKKLYDQEDLDVSVFIYISFLIFLFLSNFLGEIRFFYLRVWWWDLFLHMNAGLLLGLLGFSLIYIINEESKHLDLNPFFIVFFGFCFSMTISVFWEFFEFSVDSLIGTNMLKTGLSDTFGDLFFAALGSLMISFFGYFGLRHDYKRMTVFFKKIIKRMKR